MKSFRVGGTFECIINKNPDRHNREPALLEAVRKHDDLPIESVANRKAQEYAAMFRRTAGVSHNAVSIMQSPSSTPYWTQLQKYTGYDDLRLLLVSCPLRDGLRVPAPGEPHAKRSSMIAGITTHGA